jgi:hypothetical protein
MINYKIRYAPPNHGRKFTLPETGAVGFHNERNVRIDIINKREVFLCRKREK